MSDLTEEAKAAIADAVRIVREDKFEAFVRGRIAPPDPPNGPPAPPAKPEPTEEPKKTKAGLWWGDQLNESSEPPKPPEGGSGNAS